MIFCKMLLFGSNLEKNDKQARQGFTNLYTFTKYLGEIIEGSTNLYSLADLYSIVSKRGPKNDLRRTNTICTPLVHNHQKYQYIFCKCS